jgi:cytochrome oxidase assembly protein ShyY1
MPVVRGWVPGTPASADVPPPTGTVRVVGWLEDPESDALRPTGSAPLLDDQIGIVSSAELLSRWPYDLYQGFVVLDRQEPASELTTVVPPQALPPPTGIRWLNFGYAFQWWIFACFVVFFWVRMMREDLKDESAAADGTAELEEVR